MDVRLPVLGGLEATARIRALDGGEAVRIVGLSASAFAHEQKECLAAGMDDFLRKPFRREEIFDVMARQLGIRYSYGQAQPVHAADHLLRFSRRTSRHFHKNCVTIWPTPSFVWSPCISVKSLTAWRTRCPVGRGLIACCRAARIYADSQGVLSEMPVYAPNDTASSDSGGFISTRICKVEP